MQKIPPKQFLKVDEMIQRILLVLITITLIIYPIAMILAIPLGVCQVISGIVGASYGSKWRRIYLGFVAAYFVSMPICANVWDMIDASYGFEEIVIGFYFIVPMILGVFYYFKTRKEMPKGGSIKRMDEEDILDAELVNMVD